jgi:hypothetical protein
MKYGIAIYPSLECERPAVKGKHVVFVETDVESVRVASIYTTRKGLVFLPEKKAYYFGKEDLESILKFMESEEK